MARPMNTKQDPEGALVFRVEAGVARLRLNQPERFNPLSRTVIQAFQDAVDAIADDPSVRVLVIEAAGRAFCAGHDLAEMRAHPDAAWQRGLFEACGRLMQSMVDLPQPVIARVQGVATAAGCQLVASCDLAVASEDARFAVSGVNLGLFCSTPAVALSRKVSRGKALEMLLTGAFIDAGTACSEGLVNRVVPAAELDAAVDEYVDTLQRKPARVLALGKTLFNAQLDAPLDQAYSMAAAAMADNMMLSEAQDGIDAFLGRGRPAR
jgi:enoyl-CoA hydratase/carnithine racemase